LISLVCNYGVLSAVYHVVDACSPVSHFSKMLHMCAAELF
jgi:hypothetical protein